ncbi:hypothetical protein BESB_058360 [Besnoitia besnoiti]|uniref:Beta-Casp domain-containing protein n=1 Tax=Besnoitia besnoiti TaxID=94643 RepID=A0A2A9MAM5_BESBE|nr:hypothetical protein BESB_058360 [Besnoitia besnoiti]PFH34949.1 hypothetical protein BESB_058360 [Besnoitia besnoiti]
MAQQMHGFDPPCASSQRVFAAAAVENRRKAASASSSSPATVRVVHFASPSGETSSARPSTRLSPVLSSRAESPAPSVGASLASSACLLSRSEALLVSVSGFNLLVDCPLDFNALLPRPPRLFSATWTGDDAAANAEEEEEGDSDERDRLAGPGCGLPGVGGESTSSCSLHWGSPSSPSALSVASQSLAPCFLASPFLRVLLPLRLHAVLITHPQGALGLPLLAEVLNLANTPVFATAPVLLAASSAVRFLQSTLAGCLLPPRVSARGDRRGGSAAAFFRSGGAPQSGAQNAGDKEATQTAVAAAAAAAAAVETPDEENSNSLQEGFEGAEDGASDSEGEDPFSGTARHRRQLLGGVSKHVRATMFHQERELLLHTESQQRVTIYPVSSGYCLGGANWVLITAARQKLVIVGPSSLEALAEAAAVPDPRLAARDLQAEANAKPSNSPPSSPPQPASASGDAGPAGLVSPTSAAATASSRYPLAADWRPLADASLVVFFSCAPPLSALTPVTASSCTLPSGAAAPRACAPRPPQAVPPPSPAEACAGLSPAPSPSPPASLCGCPRTPPLAASLQELRRLLVDTLHTRGGNVLLPLDLCGLSFLEVLETVARAAAASASASRAASPAPVYCVGPGLPRLLQFAVEGAEWVCEKRAERTRDLQAPRAPFFLGACVDEELLSGKLLQPPGASWAMRTRNLILGERLTDVMPLREPSVLLLSHASLRVGEACLLLEAWKKDEKNLLICVDRRFACAGSAVSALPAASVAEGDLHPLLWPFTGRGQAARGRAESPHMPREEKGASDARATDADGRADAASSTVSSASCPASGGARTKENSPSRHSSAATGGFRMRVVSLPLDWRLDANKVVSLVSLYEPRVALLPAPVLAQLRQLACRRAAQLGQEACSSPSASSSSAFALSAAASAGWPRSLSTQLESLEVNCGKEIRLEPLLSSADAALVARAFSLLLLSQEPTEKGGGDGKSAGPVGQQQGCRSLSPEGAGSEGDGGRGFAGGAMVSVPVGRLRGVEGCKEDAGHGAKETHAGEDEVHEDGRAAKTTQARGGQEPAPCLSVGWIESGSLLRGNGEAEGAGERGLLSLILPAFSAGGSEEREGAEAARTSQHAKGDSRPSCLLFGVYYPVQLLFVLRDRGYADASLEFLPRELSSPFARHESTGKPETLEPPAETGCAPPACGGPPPGAAGGRQSLENEGARPPPERSLFADDDGEETRGWGEEDTQALIAQHVDRERLAVVSVPSLKSRVLCHSENLTEIEAPDHQTRRFLRGLVAQLLADVTQRQP